MRVDTPLENNYNACSLSERGPLHPPLLRKKSPLHPASTVTELPRRPPLPRSRRPVLHARNLEEPKPQLGLHENTQISLADYSSPFGSRPFSIHQKGRILFHGQKDPCLRGQTGLCVAAVSLLATLATRVIAKPASCSLGECTFQGPGLQVSANYLPRRLHVHDERPLVRRHPAEDRVHRPRRGPRARC